jgi:hypothetical protein
MVGESGEDPDDIADHPMIGLPAMAGGGGASSDPPLSILPWPVRRWNPPTTAEILLRLLPISRVISLLMPPIAADLLPRFQM